MFLWLNSERLLGIPIKPVKLALLQTLTRSVDHPDKSTNITSESISLYSIFTVYNNRLCHPMHFLLFFPLSVGQYKRIKIYLRCFSTQFLHTLV